MMSTGITPISGMQLTARRVAAEPVRDTAYDRIGGGSMKYVKPERVWISTHPELGERWIQERIAEDPSLLGLGDLILKDKERLQPHAGRLDLLCQDAESSRRYEIEVQLGKTDESHIIRTIEYWDVERKRYPQYEHTAVIVAEDITSRFLNVIGLFNGFIPLVAIQMQAVRLGEQVSLIFSKVLDQTHLGLVEEDEAVQEPTDRSYWEKRATRATLEMTDEIVAILRSFDPELSPKYNKFYVGLADHTGQPRNFVIFRPKKDWLRIEPRLQKSAEIQEKLEEAGLDVMDYDERWGRYRIRLAKSDVKKHEVLLTELLRRAYDEAGE